MACIWVFLCGVNVSCGLEVGLYGWAQLPVLEKIEKRSTHSREGCTLFVFLAEHRSSAHGTPRHSTTISTAFHGQPWTLHGLPLTLHGLPRTLHGLPRTFHGLPWNAAASTGTSWRPMALDMAISTVISTARFTAISTATHGIPRQATVQRKDPRQRLRYGGGHGIRRGS